MGANSNLFLMLQEQQVETNNFLPTKKEIQLSAKNFVKGTLEAGEVQQNPAGHALHGTVPVEVK